MLTIKWMIAEFEVHCLHYETLALAIQLFHRFINNSNTKISDIFIVSITCMFIAAKYEEIMPPKLIDFLHNDKFYIPLIINMERIILKTLDYKLSLPTTITYIQ